MGCVSEELADSFFMVNQEEIECLYWGRLVEGDVSKEAMGGGLLCSVMG
jgi:hypothetical protein